MGSDIRNWDEYMEILDLLKKDKKIVNFYARMKEIGSAEKEEYKEIYVECIEYQQNLIQGLRRSIKIKKILNAKKDNNTTS